MLSQNNNMEWINRVILLLEGFGFTENQVKLYLELLKEDETNASRLSKITGIHRSTTYQELEVLVKNGLASFVVKDFKRYYIAASPDKLLQILDEKKKNLQDVLPDLKGLQGISKKSSVNVEVYEGKEGIKTFYQHILNENPKEVFAFGVTGYAFEVLKYSFPQFLDKYLKAGIKARYLANFDSKKRLQESPKNIQIKYLPKEAYSNVTTIVYDEYVAIQSLIEDKIYVILIKDKNLAAGYRNYFEFVWETIP